MSKTLAEQFFDTLEGIPFDLDCDDGIVGRPQAAVLMLLRKIQGRTFRRGYELNRRVHHCGEWIAFKLQDGSVVALTRRGECLVFGFSGVDAWNICRWFGAEPDWSVCIADQGAAEELPLPLPVLFG
jgi:hypothetical protein